VVNSASEFLVNFVPECQPIKAQFHLQKSLTIRKIVTLCPDYSGKLYSGISGKHCLGIGGKHWLGTVVNFGVEYPSDERLKEELETVLNLNVNQLKENRRAIYETVRDRIRNKVKQHKTNALQKRYLESEKRKWLNLNNGKFSEFCMVGVYVIDQKLKKI
jgi:hypothetical protein